MARLKNPSIEIYSLKSISVRNRVLVELFKHDVSLVSQVHPIWLGVAAECWSLLGRRIAAQLQAMVTSAIVECEPLDTTATEAAPLNRKDHIVHSTIIMSDAVYCLVRSFLLGRL